MTQTNHRLLSKLDKRYIWHPFTQMKEWQAGDPTVIVRGKGPYLVDARGKRYLDAISSIWTNLHGHVHPGINRAIAAQLKRIAHSSALGLANEPASLLAEKLIRRVPGSLRRIFYSDDGATAVEVALKMAFQYWKHVEGRRRRDGGRRAFLNLSQAYHGDTVGAMSVGNIEVFHGTFRPLLFRTRQVMSPYCYRCPFNRACPERRDARLYRKCGWECMEAVEKEFRSAGKKGKPFAAAVIEPLIQGAAGMIAHPSGYLKQFAALCRRHDVLLILDEVMTGFGRTGTLFACEQEGVSPDLLCVAKGITGGYLPLAATFATSKIFNAFLGGYSEMKTFFHGHSYTANQLGCAAALGSLEVFDKEDVLAAVKKRGKELDEMLRMFWANPHVGDVRRAGLVAGIELVRDWKTKTPYPWTDRMGARVCEAAKELGVISRPIGNILVIMPPFCVTASQLERICRALLRGIETVCR
ncbi:MAG: adenosylmethionine--8-amino-7-oxononanoate transaminase [Verrucomicrobiae bacterium]|nr:adenosylmethionine--8-amino-7-oxononanoate transaminase [Verrucomicrobiae bacterium]